MFSSHYTAVLLHARLRERTSACTLCGSLDCRVACWRREKDDLLAQFIVPGRSSNVAKALVRLEAERLALGEQWVRAPLSPASE